MSNKKNVSIVILNYNSEQDVMVSAPQLSAQLEVMHSLIIVDNASNPESIERIKGWLAVWKPEAIVGTQEEVNVWVKNNPRAASISGRVYLISHNENNGYSAGNNIGIRLADSLGVDAVLIANPDMRIEDPYYLSKLASTLFADKVNYVAASRILGLDNKDQNPLREASFLEEFFWPRFYFTKIFGAHSYVLPYASKKPIPVPKVSGCCLLLRMSFLRSTDYLDENVFLYCEEPILAARVQQNSGRIIYVPSISAVHAHIRSEKANTSLRMLAFIKSRIFYLKNYSAYNSFKLFFLYLSYGVLFLLHKIKANIF